MPRGSVDAGKSTGAGTGENYCAPPNHDTEIGGRSAREHPWQHVPSAHPSFLLVWCVPIVPVTVAIAVAARANESSVQPTVAATSAQFRDMEAANAWSRRPICWMAILHKDVAATYGGRTHVRALDRSHRASAPVATDVCNPDRIPHMLA